MTGAEPWMIGGSRDTREIIADKANERKEFAKEMKKAVRTLETGSKIFSYGADPDNSLYGHSREQDTDGGRLSNQTSVENLELNEMYPEQEVVNTNDEDVQQGSKMYCPACGSPEYEECIAEVAEERINNLNKVVSTNQQDDFSFFVAFKEVSLSQHSQMAADLRNISHFAEVEFVGEYEAIIEIATREVTCEECGFEWQYTIDRDSDPLFQPHTLDMKEEEIDSLERKAENLEDLNNDLLQQLAEVADDPDTLDMLAEQTDEPGVDLTQYSVDTGPNHAFNESRDD